jgi:hypothetical protein
MYGSTERMRSLMRIPPFRGTFFGLIVSDVSYTVVVPGTGKPIHKSEVGSSTEGRTTSLPE